MKHSPRDVLLFELAERVVRLLSHAQLSRQIASRHASRVGAQDEAAESIEDALLNSFVVLRRAALQDSGDDSETIDAITQVKQYVDYLHINLLQYIPRPYEPVELLSFIRQSLATGNDASHKPIFASEQLYSSCFGFDPIEKMSRRFEMLANSLAGRSYDSIDFRTSQLDAEETSCERKSGGYISIPRVDLNNPCSWPSLIHEFRHQSDPLSGDELRRELKEYLGDEAYDRLLNSCGSWIFITGEQAVDVEKCLSDWLLECWCDCAGIKVLGPSIWFSQAYAFLFSDRYITHARPLATTIHNKTSYPPALFRLRVLRSILEHRYDVDDGDVKAEIFEAIDEVRDALTSIYYRPKNPGVDPCAAHIHQVIANFLSSKINGDLRGSEGISFADLSHSVDALNSGEPIPTIGQNPFSDRKAVIGEILLAGWLNRLGKHRDKVLDYLRDGSSTQDKVALIAVQKCVDRFDESLKRSIQVAEWVHVFRDGQSSLPLADSSVSPPIHKGSALPSLLSDRDIREVLRSRHLRVIPLINPALQISATSVDVRLGHNFEIFFPDVRGVIDPVDGPSSLSIGQPESMDVQIDIGNGITIHPGQFVLAHTLEYLRLPMNVAGQIEGRSSFARLGLQVHMTANLVEAGFEGSLTLEIANVGPNAIKLYPGTRIGQLRFFGINSDPDSSRAITAPKYSGLLSQNKTRQDSDQEVEVLRKFNKRQREVAEMDGRGRP